MTDVGPVNLATGFPTWLQDNPGLRLAPCDVVTWPVDPGCPGLALVDPNLGFVAGNIEEVTFYRAKANIVGGPNGETFRLRNEVQGGVALEEEVSNAVSIPLRNLTVAGVYTVTTPFGIFVF